MIILFPHEIIFQYNHLIKEQELSFIFFAVHAKKYILILYISNWGIIIIFYHVAEAVMTRDSMCHGK